MCRFYTIYFMKYLILEGILCLTKAISMFKSSYSAASIEWVKTNQWSNMEVLVETFNYFCKTLRLRSLISFYSFWLRHWLLKGEFFNNCKVETFWLKSEICLLQCTRVLKCIKKEYVWEIMRWIISIIKGGVVCT